VAAADVKTILVELEKKGMKVNAVNDVNAFRKSVTPVYDKFRKSDVGPLLDKVLAAVK
jgi:TRAP-type C4-dicarboxylate transport system substrate-binding protein